MEKFKQHYEKIILGVLSLGFIFALIYLLQMVESANNITEGELKFTAPAKRYEALDFKSAAFNVDEQLGKLSVWSVREDINNMGFTSELMVPMPSLRCESCRKILPWVIAQTKKVCPHARCGAKLGDPGTPPDPEKMVASLDSDNDGMPDRYELKMSFNPVDASDADQDKDNDGFSNLYEYMVKTDPLNPKSYPSLEKCLFLVKLERVEMPVKLLGVTAIKDDTAPNGFKILDIAMTINGRRTSVEVAQVIKIGQREFKILTVEPKVGDEQAASVVLDNDRSEVVIAPVINGTVDEEKKIVLKVGAAVYEPMPRAHIRDVRYANSKKGNFRVNVNDSFTMQADDNQRLSFQVVSIDAVAETVVVLNSDTQEEFLLPKASRIPQNAYMKRDGGSTGSFVPESTAPSTPRRGPRNPRPARSLRN